MSNTIQAITTATAATMTPLVRTPQPQAEPAPIVQTAALPGGLSAVMELAKMRITRLVTMTAAVGFVLAMVGHMSDKAALTMTAIGCVIGTGFSAAGANALNQWWEHQRDAKMPRTASRPIPTNRLTPGQGAMWGMSFSAFGVAALLVMCGPAAAAVSLVTILVYVLLYTPMKPVTPFSTLVGAVPGALPPLIGWCAARTLDPQAAVWTGLAEWGGWSLFGLMFVWQIPHFLAIAWMYREDYERGGFRMLPIFDRTGHLTSLFVTGWAVLLIPATVAPAIAMPDRLGLAYVIVASVSGFLFLAAAMRLMLKRSRDAARAVFIGSIIHLPVLLMVMVGEVIVRLLWP